MALVDRVVAAWGLVARDASPQFTHALVVKRLGGAHEDVVAAVCGVETKLARHLLVVTDDVIRLFFRRASGLLSRALDIDAVLVSAG